MSTSATDIVDVLSERLRQIGVTIPPDADQDEVLRILNSEISIVKTRDWLGAQNQLTVIGNAFDAAGIPPAPQGHPQPVVVRFVEYNRTQRERIDKLQHALDDANRSR